MNDESPAFSIENARYFFEEVIPFCRYWKMEIQKVDYQGVEIILPFREEFVGDPRRPALHGGVISALLDTAGGFAAIVTLDWQKETLSTIDMRIDYLRPGQLEDLIGEAVVLRRGKKVIATQMRAYHPSNGETVAEGRAVYSVSEREI